MSKLLPPSPESIDVRLAGLNAKKISLAAEYGAALEKASLTPDDVKCRQDAISIGNDLRLLEDQIKRLTEKRKEAEAQYAADRLNARLAQGVVDVEEVDAITGEMLAKVTQVVDHFAILRPLFTGIVELNKERTTLARGVAAATKSNVDAHDLLPLFSAMIEKALHDAGIDAILPVSYVYAQSTHAGLERALARARERTNTVLYNGLSKLAKELGVPDPVPPVTKLAPVTLVAIERARVGDRFVEVGQQYVFDPTPAYPGGQPKPMPKWAKAPDEAAAILKHRASRSQDTKPKEARQSSGLKAESTRAAFEGRK